VIELPRPLPHEPRVVLLRVFTFVVSALEPDDALGEHDLGGEVGAVGKQMSPRRNGIETDREQQREQSAAAPIDVVQSSLDEVYR
jgi:hypothetical protein